MRIVLLGPGAPSCGVGTTFPRRAGPSLVSSANRPHPGKTRAASTLNTVHRSRTPAATTNAPRGATHLRAPRPLGVPNIVLDDLDQEAHPAGTPVCSLCGRLQHRRSQSPGGSAGDAESHAFPDDTSEVQDQRTEKRGGSSLGANVSGLQLHDRQGPQAAHRAPGRRPVQGAGPGTDASDAGCEPGRNGRETARYVQGRRGYLAFCETSSVFARLGLVGPAAVACRRLEPMAERPAEACGVAQTERVPRLGGPNHGKLPRPLAAQQQSGAASRLPHGVLHFVRASPISPSTRCTNRTAVYGPVRTVM
jgi:hypothetical protein